MLDGTLSLEETLATVSGSQGRKRWRLCLTDCCSKKRMRKSELEDGPELQTYEADRFSVAVVKNTFSAVS